MSFIHVTEREKHNSHLIVTWQYMNWCGAIATEQVDRASAAEKCVASSNQHFRPPTHDNWEEFLQLVHAA